MEGVMKRTNRIANEIESSYLMPEYPDPMNVGYVQAQGGLGARGMYTHKTRPLDSINNEPTTYSTHRVRTPSEMDADSNLSKEELNAYGTETGLSLRMAVSNQGRNDQFSYK